MYIYKSGQLAYCGLSLAIVYLHSDSDPTGLSIELLTIPASIYYHLQRELVMATMDVGQSRLFDILKDCGNLFSVVDSESQRRNVQLMSYSVEEGEELSPSEERKIKEQAMSFGEELKFTVPVNLRESKSAFRTVMNTDSDPYGSVDLMSVWGLAKTPFPSSNTIPNKPGV